MSLGEVSSSVEHLRNAVPGLAGATGFLLLPMLGAWLRLLVEILEWGRAGIARPRRLSGVGFLKAAGLSVIWVFFLFTTVRAAGELREIQIEAPVVGSSLRGMFVGIGLWTIYGLGISVLRSGARQRMVEKRMRGLS
jgi:hypothetical protein